MKKFLLSTALILAVAVLLYPENSGAMDYNGKVTPGRWLRNLKVEYKGETEKKYVRMQIFFPKTYQRGESCRTLIVLHGYDGNYRDWEKNTRIEHYANEYGFVLVCPDMGKSLYESKFYPETTNKWAEIPGGKFVAEVLMEYLRDEFDLAQDRKKTGIIGLSTGARGAILLAAKYSDSFAATAGLSGDYDPTSMTKDRLLTSVYGPYKEFTERWKNDDNVMKLAENLEKTPVYLWHGAKDWVVPAGQSMIFALRLRQLQKKHGGFDVTFKKAKHKIHDWNSWNSALPDIMLFFDRKLSY